MPTAPEWFEKALTQMRGRSLYGDPVIRVVWGADERDHRGNYKYVHPDGGPMNCFILERWQPAGFFGSRTAWEQSDRSFDDIKQEWVNKKGPYPSRGAYVMICPLWTNEGGYLPIDESVLIGVREKILKDEEFAEVSAIERGYAVESAHKAQQDAADASADIVQADIRDYHLTNWDKINRSTSRAYSTHPR